MNIFNCAAHFMSRVLNDMVLWEPLAPRPLDHGMPGATTAQPLTDLNIHPTQLDSFQQCKSNVGYGKPILQVRLNCYDIDFP